MADDRLTQELYNAICDIPLIDPHSHIDPHKPASRTLDDILGYHYYTELAHSAGMDKAPLAASVSPRERVGALFAHLDRIDNTVQYSWFLEIARTFFSFEGERLTGIVNRITRRATVLVPHPQGVRYSDGGHYRKYYIPLGQLEKLDGTMG